MDPNAPKPQLTKEVLAAFADMRRALRGRFPLSPRLTKKSSKAWKTPTRVFYAGSEPYVKRPARPARAPRPEEQAAAKAILEAALEDGAVTESKPKHKGKRTRRREREAKRAAARARRRDRP